MIITKSELSINKPTTLDKRELSSKSFISIFFHFSQSVNTPWKLEHVRAIRLWMIRTSRTMEWMRVSVYFYHCFHFLFIFFFASFITKPFIIYIKHLYWTKDYLSQISTVCKRPAVLGGSEEVFFDCHFYEWKSISDRYVLFVSITFQKRQMYHYIFVESDTPLVWNSSFPIRDLLLHFVVTFFSI